MSTFSSEPGVRFRTLVEALYAAPPDQPFVTMWRGEDEITSATFGEFRRLAAIQAAGMLKHGARPGDTIVLIMPQGVPLMGAFAGAMTIGAVPAILAYPNFKVEPGKYRAGLAGVTRNLKARLVVVDETLPQEFMSYLDTGGGTGVIRGIDRPGPGRGTGLPQRISRSGQNRIHSTFRGDHRAAKGCGVVACGGPAPTGSSRRCTESGRTRPHL